MVGRRAAVPRPGVRAHASSARAAEDGGRHDIHVVTDGIEAALAQARAAAGEANIAIAGGAATVNQYLAAGLIDELRLHVAPLLLGAGERLFDGVGNLTLEPLQVRHSGLVIHLSYRIHPPTDRL
jgi:dihydrofolate reductase